MENTLNIDSPGPLFLLDVDRLIGNKDYRSALELCTAGLSIYPRYETAYKRLDNLNDLIDLTPEVSEEPYIPHRDLEEATLLTASDITVIPGIEFLQNELPRSEEEIISTSLLKELPEMSLDGLISHSAFRHELISGNQDIPDDEFNILAGKISKMSFVPQDYHDEFKEQDDELSDPNLITETMANIYVMQGAYMQAISAFEALAERYPFKSDIYKQKIAELETDMNAAL